jgi:hypothetical protein
LLSDVGDAAEPSGDPARLWRAAGQLAITGSALDSESAGLIEVDSRVRFRHPLVRSAVYGAATADERRHVHRVLAEATARRPTPTGALAPGQCNGRPRRGRRGGAGAGR